MMRSPMRGQNVFQSVPSYDVDHKSKVSIVVNMSEKYLGGVQRGR